MSQIRSTKVYVSSDSLISRKDSQGKGGKRLCIVTYTKYLNTHLVSTTNEDVDTEFNLAVVHRLVELRTSTTSNCEMSKLSSMASERKRLTDQDCSELCILLIMYFLSISTIVAPYRHKELYRKPSSTLLS